MSRFYVLHNNIAMITPHIKCYNRLIRMFTKDDEMNDNRRLITIITNDKTDYHRLIRMLTEGFENQNNLRDKVDDNKGYDQNWNDFQDIYEDNNKVDDNEE